MTFIRCRAMLFGNKLRVNKTQQLLEYQDSKNMVKIVGTDGDDTLVGTPKNDRFIGSAGNDTLDGGAGSDTSDYSQLGESITIVANGLITATVIKGNGLGTDTLLNFDGAIADANAVNNTLDYSTSTSSVLINVNLGNDTIIVTGIPGGGTISAQVANFDNVKGKNSNDILVGSNEDNQLFGNAGDDILSGGLGNDILSGGLGADTFVFNSLLEGFDIIKDFNAVEGDKIQISQAAFGVTSLNEFRYDALNGSLFFQEIKFAVIENNPVGFLTNLGIELV